MTELLPHDPPAGHRDGIIFADRLDHAELSKMGVFFVSDTADLRSLRGGVWLVLSIGQSV
jgi:hypothetical protein